MSIRDQRRMTRPATVALFAGLMAALGGCGPLISVGGDGKPPTLYTVTPPAPAATDRAALPVTLIVAEPGASDALDSRRIALKPSALEVRYYADVRWTDRAPRLMQNLLVSSFDGLVANVAANSMPLVPTYRLTSRLVAFEARYPRPKTAVATVALELQLYSTRPLALVATTRVTSEEAATADKSAAISRAFNTAAQDAVHQAVTWAYGEMAKNADTLAQK